MFRVLRDVGERSSEATFQDGLLVELLYQYQLADKVV